MKEFYSNNAKRTQQELEILEKDINRNSFMRLALIIIGAIALFQIFQINNIWLLLGAVFVLVIGFSFLVLRQSKLEKLREEKRAYLRVNENELNMLSHAANMYSDGSMYQDAKHAYSSDLDIFGEKSLFSILNRCATSDGQDLLSSWLIQPASKQAINLRQQAAEELSAKKDWIQFLQTKLLFNLGQKINIKTFLMRYMDDSAFQFGSAFMRICVRIVPFIFLIGIIISVFVTPIWNYLLLLAVINLLWSLSQGGKVSYFSSRIDKIGMTLIAYSDAVKMVEDEQFDAVCLQDLQKNLSTGKQIKLSAAFKHLGSLVDKLDTRNNILIGSLLNMILLWDFKQVLAIVNWRNQFQGDVLKAFDVIAEFEALVSLAVLKNNNASWVTPIILDDAQKDRIFARELGHPLINADTSVLND